MLLKYNQRIFECTDPASDTYSGVLFSAYGDGTATATATDGKTLTRIEVRVQDGETVPDAVLLSAADMKAAWGRGKADREIGLVDGRWILAVGDQVTRIRVIDAQFPDADRVVPKPTRDRLLTFNVKLLVQLAKAAGADDVTLEVPEFKTGRNCPTQVREPIRIRMRDTYSTDDIGVLMPIVLD